MSNISKFQSVFEVDFPVEVADQVLARMQKLYGDAFDKKYGEIAADELQHTACTVLNGLSPNDLRRGLERMNAEKWCPSLPEFRSWCVHDGDWWTAEQAWAKALNFDADKTQKITTLAKQALDEVRHILKTEGQKTAHFAFRDIYNDYLDRAKKSGRVQVMWIKPQQSQTEKTQSHHKRTPIPAELAAQLKLICKSGGKSI
ncbi:restriction endonuclease [Acinetobacter sp. NIPH 1852]|uniref:restriction endonuclease n=1 Tax=Acinetobacter sp. NIPH 1852 TaxID=2923428 RepID=UPI001F4AE7A9|nr:restriction endonuclease [Acinetobacter sp. NIPH 1852]MCH7307808.1 restriction endonuclease [Acinetobacter sp. NIPH 1852]